VVVRPGDERLRLAVVREPDRRLRGRQQGRDPLAKTIDTGPGERRDGHRVGSRQFDSTEGRREGLPHGVEARFQAVGPVQHRQERPVDVPECLEGDRHPLLDGVGPESRVDDEQRRVGPAAGLEGGLEGPDRLVGQRSDEADRIRGDGRPVGYRRPPGGRLKRLEEAVRRRRRGRRLEVVVVRPRFDREAVREAPQ